MNAIGSKVAAKSSAVRATNMTRDYGDGKGLFSVSFELSWGEIVSVMGANGCGKTTLVRCIGCFEPLNEGLLHIGDDYRFDAGMNGIDEGLLDQMRGRTLGIVFQHYDLFPHLTVRDNLVMPLREVCRIPRGEAVERIEPLLREFNLLDRLELFPHQLSGGLRQRVAFVRCLSLRPRILVLDEVTSGLDPAWAECIAARIVAFAKEGGAVINVSHQIGLVRTVSDRVFFMRDGRLDWSGSTQDLDSSGNEKLDKFLRTA